MEKELLLRDIYYSPKVGFRSIKHIYEMAKKEDKNITESDVKNFLQTQHTYTKYKTFSSPSFFRKTMVRHLGEQVQIDLVFLEKHNDKGYHIILNCIEILSRYAFTRPLKNYQGPTILENLKEIFEEFKERFHDYPKLVQTDEGIEFKNVLIQKYFKKHNIISFSTFSKRKASIVERFNRTMKDKLKKLHDYRKNHVWVDDLPNITENYNNQEHRSIGMKPSEVNFSNQFIVWQRLYGHIMNHVKEPKYKVGDRVKVLHFIPPHGKEGEKFRKYYKKKHPELYEKDGKFKLREGRMGVVKDIAPFSDEIFKIDQVLYGDPIVYKLYSEEENIEILGKFYESELSLVR